MEIWKPIPEFEDTYEVSSLGRIRSIERKVWHRNRWITRKSKLITPVFLNRKGGYFVVALIRNKVRKNVRFAPIVARVFNGYDDKQIKNLVGYVDGNPKNVRASNLFWSNAMDTAPKDGEIWVASDEYDGVEVSNFGRVKKDGFFLNLIGAKQGYKRVSLYKGGKLKSVGVHILVAKAFVQNPNPLRYNIVDHIDKNTSNNTPENLRWCTQKMNMEYSSNKRELVPFIKYDISRGLKYGEIAKKYGCSTSLVYRIKSRKVHKDIEPYDPDRR